MDESGLASVEGRPPAKPRAKPFPFSHKSHEVTSKVEKLLETHLDEEAKTLRGQVTAGGNRAPRSQARILFLSDPSTRLSPLCGPASFFYLRTGQKRGKMRGRESRHLGGRTPARSPAFSDGADGLVCGAQSLSQTILGAGGTAPPGQPGARCKPNF